MYQCSLPRLSLGELRRILHITWSYGLGLESTVADPETLEGGGGTKKHEI